MYRYIYREISGVGLIQTHLFATLSFMFSPTPEIYIIFTALVLPLSTFMVDEVFRLSAASHIYIYYMEKSVLLGTKPLVDSIRHFIRDPSGVFSVCHLCECRIVQ